jgi:hypothetical protein
MCPIGKDVIAGASSFERNEREPDEIGCHPPSMSRTEVERQASDTDTIRVTQ